jgi:tRNA-specific 2-thiouridylase
LDFGLEMLDQKKKIVVGLSGGVDSAVAALLLQKAGFDVIGVMLKLWSPEAEPQRENRCCGLQAVEDARKICSMLDIPFYLLDQSEAFLKKIVSYFVTDYKNGRTPNPCVYCNDSFKFGALIKYAEMLGAEFVATGHYARIQTSGDKRFLLLRGLDLAKDQSYFLFNLTQEKLSKIKFPLGELTKAEVRKIASDARLLVANKADSVEICFVNTNNYGHFLKLFGGVQEHKGEIVDEQGNVLGFHNGIEFYTIGQRKGLRVAWREPLYVIGIDPDKNRLIVGPASRLYNKEFYIDNCNWIEYEKPKRIFEAMARIRYKHQAVPARIELMDDGYSAKVNFLEPQRAITPGQACVFYENDIVIGGGWIREVVSHCAAVYAT